MIISVRKQAQYLICEYQLIWRICAYIYKYANDVGEMGDLGPLMYFTRSESIEIGLLEIDLWSQEWTMYSIFLLYVDCGLAKIDCWRCEIFNLDIRQIYKYLHYRIRVTYYAHYKQYIQGLQTPESTKYADFYDLYTVDEIFETKTCYSLPYCGQA